MGKKKKKTRIHVDDLPNGFGATINGKEYMTFTPLGLIEAIYVHAELGMDEYLDHHFIDNLTMAAATWPQAADAIKGAAEQLEVTRQVRKELSDVRKALQSAQDKVEELQIERRKTLDKLYIAQSKANDYDSMENKYKTSYNLYNSECKKTTKLEKEVKRLKDNIASQKRVKEWKQRKRTREEVEKDNFEDRY